jgi:UDP-glucose 4-epimerase
VNQILITGGTGFVGGRLSKKLGAFCPITITSRKALSEDVRTIHNASFSLLHSNLLSREHFPSNVHTVIHLAGLNEWDCINNPSEAIKVNIDETRIILENAIARGVENFVYFSTAHVYGSPLKGVISESDLTYPTHPYAITHRGAEDYVVAATLKKRINGVVVRLSNSFGAPVLPSVNRWTLLTNDLAKQAIENESLQLQSNGCQYRDFICLSDVECVIYEMITRGVGGFDKLVYNLGAGSSMRVIDMATKIADVYQEVFDRQIKIHLPKDSAATSEPFLDFSIKKLLSEKISIRNDVDAELRDLLLFCKLNFKKNN